VLIFVDVGGINFGFACEAIVCVVRLSGFGAMVKHGLTRLSAEQVFIGSNPIRASGKTVV
jgi:hypothetical protein